jgi:hypothetical protein
LLGRGLDKAVLLKLMDATIRYNPERDRLLLTTFECKQMDYETFRTSLQTSFNISFSPLEFAQLLKLLDMGRNNSGYVDGTNFIVLFIKLNNLRRDNEANKVS